MEILSIIPARGGSKAIPLKNLATLNSKPLIYYTINASLNSKFITRTIVSTDHEKISEVASSFGAEIIHRPKELSTDTSSVELTMKHVIEYLEKKENYIPDVVMLLQNTSPLRTSSHIDEALELMISNNFDSVLSGFSSHLFLWKKNNQSMMPVDYDPKNRPNRQEIDEQYFENGALFATKYENFKNTECRISGKIGFYKMPMELSYNIDTEDDLISLRKFLS